MRRWFALGTLAALLLLPLAGCQPPSQPTTNTTTPSTQPPASTTPTSSTSSTSTTGAKAYTAKLTPFNGSKVHGMALVIVNPSSSSSDAAGGGLGTSEGTSGTSGMPTGTTESSATSGASGTGSGSATGTVIRVIIVAAGLTKDQTHAMHIHGFTTGTASAIPPTASASNPTTESVAEQTYGPVLLPLEPFPTASASGTVSYTKVLSAPQDVLTPSLENKAVVLHGMDVNGSYDPGVPVAVGILRLAKQGNLRGDGTTSATPGGSETSMPGGSTGTTP